MRVAYFVMIAIVANINAEVLDLLPNFTQTSIDNYDHENLIKCIMNILKKYYNDVNKLTYINMSGHNDDFLDDINALNTVAVTVRTVSKSLGRKNKSYLVIVENDQVFSETVNLNKEIYWNPYAKFLVVIYNLQHKNLRNIFNILLRLRVNNVVVMNGTQTAELYTYNPFENYACGNYFSRIIEYGQCSKVTENIYPEKVLTGVERCTFKVSIPHWPPFTIDPAQTEPGLKTYGVEQVMLQMISQIEKFTCNYTFDFDPEFFSLISKDASINGPLAKLQNNESDIMMGGMFLTTNRARVFFYLHGHLDFSDEVKIVVKRSTTIPPWMDVYKDFSMTVWVLLIAMFALYSFIMMMLLRTKDKIRISMVLLDNLLAHGTKLNSYPLANIVFIIWVWFALLVNCFYTTSLFSRTTKPSVAYQINDEQSALRHRLKPCLWETMQRFVNAEGPTVTVVEPSLECHSMMRSLATLSRSSDVFSIIPNFNFLYNKMQFYDQYGKSPFYAFDKPYNKLIYSLYFYNGFPASERLHTISLRIKETGILDKTLRDIYYARLLKYNFKNKEFTSRFAVPWHIYAVGVSVSLITLIVEIASKYK